MSNSQSQLNYTALLGDLKQKNWWFEIGDLIGGFTKKLVSRMDGAPNHIKIIENEENSIH